MSCIAAYHRHARVVITSKAIISTRHLIRKKCTSNLATKFTCCPSRIKHNALPSRSELFLLRVTSNKSNHNENRCLTLRMGIDPSARASRLRHRMPAVHSTCSKHITKHPDSTVHWPRFHAHMPVSSSCLRATIDQMSYQSISRAPDFLWSCRSQSKTTAVYCLGPAITAVELGNNSLQQAQGEYPTDTG